MDLASIYKELKILELNNFTEDYLKTESRHFSLAGR